MQKTVRKPIPNACDKVTSVREKQEELLDNFWNTVVDRLAAETKWPIRLEIDTNLESETLSPLLTALELEGWKAEIFHGSSHDPCYTLIISPADNGPTT